MKSTGHMVGFCFVIPCMIAALPLVRPHYFLQRTLNSLCCLHNQFIFLPTVFVLTPYFLLTIANSPLPQKRAGRVLESKFGYW